MLEANSFVQVNEQGLCVPAGRLWEFPSIYDPIDDCYDEITDILVREVDLGIDNCVKFIPYQLPPIDKKSPQKAALTSPRQIVLLPPYPEVASGSEQRPLQAKQIGLPCVDYLGNPVTYVAIFFARPRTVQCGGYSLSCYTPRDLECI